MRSKLPRSPVLIPPQAKRVFKGIIYDTYQWEQKLYDGTTAVFEMLRRPDTVKVVAVKGDQVVIIKQEQPHLGSFYDIPGGIHDHEDEDELDAAKRELLEETGFTFKTWKLLSMFQPHTKIEQFVYTFLATDLEKEQAQSLDGGEKIQVELMPFAEAKKILASDQSRYPVEEIANANSLGELLQLPAL